MALILVRGENNSNIITSIEKIEYKCRLRLISKPKLINPFIADSIVESILKSEVRRKSRVAVAFFVEGSDSFSILRIKKIHLPAHVIVVSNSYEEYLRLEYLLDDSKTFNRFRSLKIVNNGMIDYSMNKNDRVLIKNDKLNSYINK